MEPAILRQLCGKIGRSVGPSPALGCTGWPRRLAADNTQCVQEAKVGLIARDGQTGRRALETRGKKACGIERQQDRNQAAADAVENLRFTAFSCTSAGVKQKQRSQ